jgi:uncharacterized protein YodC (DUF2158 family)
MADIKDGGPAFPHQGYSHQGLSIRDWFAGQALAGLIVVHPQVNGLDALAVDAYRIADAMLAEREKGR